MQMLSVPGPFTIADHRRMQLDNLHLRAASEARLFTGWTSQLPQVERARQLLAAWDGRLKNDSAAAALYDVWRGVSTAPEREAARPIAERQLQHETSLTRAVDQMVTAQGADWSTWRWGRVHTRAFPYPMIPSYSLATVERPGGTGTVAADGATYREIFDVADWDRSIGTNVPGQSAQPESPFFSNLHSLWANDEYFPLVFSRPRVNAAAAHRLTLR
jgi:penicillin amidase